jgi:hypothetical protein
LKIITFVAGDNFWPLMYLQIAENVRLDVVVMCPNLLNAGWYVKQITESYPNLPLNLTAEELANAALVFRQDSTITTQVWGAPDSYQLTDGAKWPAT